MGNTTQKLQQINEANPDKWRLSLEGQSLGTFSKSQEPTMYAILASRQNDKILIEEYVESVGWIVIN